MPGGHVGKFLSYEPGGRASVPVCVCSPVQMRHAACVLVSVFSLAGNQGLAPSWSFWMTVPELSWPE